MVNILGINLSEITQSEVLNKIADFLNGSQQHYIVTPNPEIILESHRDEEFFYILNKASLSLADGFGLIIASRIFGAKLTRVTGSDLTVKLLEISETKKTRVLILNWENGLSTVGEISATLNKKYPDLIFKVINISRNLFLNSEIVKEINNFSPAILFNTLGFPYQEKLIFHNLVKLPSVKVALGIGGSFDFITEKIKRSPLFLQRLGLEWFWRLLNAFNYKNSATRIKRIFAATFIFLAKVLKARFINPLIYRQNVACLVYKREAGEIKFLLVEREDQIGHWQIPQGGTDGEDLETAGSRELREEIGTEKFLEKATFRKVSKYKFQTDRNLKGSRQFAHNFKGQSQGLFVAEFTGVDSDININFWDHRAFKWVTLDKFISTSYISRRPGYEKFLNNFLTLKIS